MNSRLHIRGGFAALIATLAVIYAVPASAAIPASAAEPANGLAKAATVLENAAKSKARGGEQAASAEGASFDSIMDLVGEMAVSAHPRARRTPEEPKFIPAHDYTVCNGPQCFSCTHVYETVCHPVKKRICSHIGTDGYHCEVVIEEECSQVSRGHTCS